LLIAKDRLKDLISAIAGKMEFRPAIIEKDYYLTVEFGFNFLNTRFIELFKRKLTDENYQGDFRINFGLTKEQLENLQQQVEPYLLPVIRAGEQFDLQRVLDRFNGILRIIL